MVLVGNAINRYTSLNKTVDMAIGLEGLLQADGPVRHEAKRRRIRTVIQELITLAAHYSEASRQCWLSFSKTATALPAFKRVYNRLAYG